MASKSKGGKGDLGVVKIHRQSVKKKTSDGNSRRSRPSNKHKKRSTKPYRGQGHP